MLNRAATARNISHASTAETTRSRGSIELGVIHAGSSLDSFLNQKNSDLGIPCRVDQI
jgi:hypothetical protein